MFGLGFGVGVLITSLQNFMRERDMLDRIAWRNPEDYWFFKHQQKKDAMSKKDFKLPKFGWLKNKKREEQKPIITAEQVSKAVESKIEAQVNAMDEAKLQTKAYLKHREDSAKVGAFTGA